MKYALVTGSTKGIGLATAEKFVQNGCYVFINGRGKNPELPLPSEFHCYVRADLSTIDGVTKLSDVVLAKTQKLDYLVLSAGATCRKSPAEIEYSDWQMVMDTNVNMPFFLIQRLWDSIADGGSIVFISSAMSLKPHAESVPYGVSKAAVNVLAQSLVKEFAPCGIRVNVICPGFIDTDWQHEKPPWLREKIKSKIALGRFGSPGEIADLCYALTQNSYINGAIVPADGGYDYE